MHLALALLWFIVILIIVFCTVSIAVLCSLALPVLQRRHPHSLRNGWEQHLEVRLKGKEAPRLVGLQGVGVNRHLFQGKD